MSQSDQLPSAMPSAVLLARRKRLINSLATDISEMKRSILSNETSIANFQTRGSGDAEYNSIRIENSTKNIEDLRARIARAEQKIEQVDAGVFDFEIEKEVKRQKVAAAEKAANDLLIAESDNACKEAGKKQSKAFYEIERSSKYNERTLEKEVAKFWDVVDTLPPNIAKNIETTPCNRCYKYRGVCFYGKRPEQKPDMIFQKTHDGTLITEITDFSVTTYIKPFNGANKTLVSKYRRDLTANLSAPAKMTMV